ncbi:MAG: RHS repeat-associated core domain-containing protein [Planctomycetota bacterium]|jgi:RHS repeat-associated protein
MELNGSTVEKAYIYARGQILAQHGATATTNKHFYLHDRLGSVRQIINYADSQVNVKNRYTYKPFGELFEKSGEDETEETVTNSFKFTGQYYDSEIGQYYLRARQYNPYLARFTARDPVRGKFQEPLTLHRYLYCINDPINRIDPSGLTVLEAIGTASGMIKQALGWRAYLISPILTGWALYTHGLNLANYAVSSEDWRFFDLAESTFNFMLPGMALAGIGPHTLRGAATGIVFGTTFERLTRVTGMGTVTGAMLSPYAYTGYVGWMLNERVRLGIDQDEFQEFVRSKDPFWS